MAKAIFCATCGTVRTLDVSGDTTTCDCGMVVGWWINSEIGLAKMHVMDQAKRDQARVILMHNGFLRADFDMIPSTFKGADGTPSNYSSVETDTFWRQVHNEAQSAPRYPEAIQIFDRSRRGCPLVVQVPGTTPDTTWATEPELRDRGLLREPVTASA